MDCKSLHENSQNGQYWANASHFLICSYAHSHYFYGLIWNELEGNRGQKWNQFQTAFTLEAKDSLLKVSFESYGNNYKSLNYLKVLTFV